MRNLNSCPFCSRQYDVTRLQAGTAVRCSCGTVFTVEVRRPRAPRALCCSRCGGTLQDAARRCDYCGAEVTLEERRLDSICPDCGARLAGEARYCMNCGIRIAPQAVEELLGATPCPRCAAGLRSRVVCEFHVIECRACGGLWLEAGTLQRLSERAEDDPEVLALLEGAPAPEAGGREHGPGYLPCIRCGQRMLPKNFGERSGVVFDYCKDHGIWLDHGELEKILAFTRAGGLVEARRREVRRLRKEADQARRARTLTEFQPPVPPGSPLGAALQGPGATVLEGAARWLGRLVSGF